LSVRLRSEPDHRLMRHWPRRHGSLREETAWRPPPNAWTQPPPSLSKVDGMP
jgi:hypothetical protein